MSNICFGDILYIKGRIGWQALGKDEYLSSGDCYLVTGVDITNYNRIDFDKCFYVSKERYEMDPNIQLKNGDIIVTKDGTIGKIGVVENLSKPATLNSHLFLIRNLRNDVLDSTFLFYILRSDYFQKFATNNSSGSNILGFTQANIQKFSTNLPPVREQRKIASFLEGLDDIIRNNVAICADLEAMAKLLYDYWFVQFDFPDENGKPYKSSGGKMVWNEELKREIPEGWEVVPISSICTVVSGYPFDSDSYNENGNYHVLTIKNIQDGHVSPITNSNVSEIPSDIPDYDILHIGDILMSLTGNVGRVAVLCGENYLLNQRASLIQPEDSRIKWYLYFLFRSETIFTQIQRVATGTSQKNVSPTDIGNIRIAHSDDIVRAFSSYIESIMQKFVHSNVENQQLAFLRDFLLPMLMNGQVKVGETKE